MSNIEAYEQNLDARLRELQTGDRAHDHHTEALIDSILFAMSLRQDTFPQRVLDCGSGLGFTTARLSRHFDVVGIDPSSKAIALAQEEHTGVTFYESTAEAFPDKMVEEDIAPFDHVILNMVLHAVDDQTARNMLAGVKNAMKPKGVIHLIVPTPEWVVFKLVDYAQAQGMEQDPGLRWVQDKVNKPVVEIPVRVSDGEFYDAPIRIHNRTLDDYGDLLTEAGFGIWHHEHSPETGEVVESMKLPFWLLSDYTTTVELAARYRELLMSAVQEESTL